MFTGIVEETGVVESIQPTTRSIVLTVRPRICAKGLKVGDSLAVNGCCLTVAGISRKGRAKLARFDLLLETWNKTNFRELVPGSLVNLERSLRANDRMGGHFVTGHIDGVGRITRWERAGQDWVLEVEAPQEVMRYVIYKGSIAVDGISLTVADVLPNGFRVWIIPHTFEVTNLRERKPGQLVNLEADLIGKYVAQLLQQIQIHPK
ncbi:MAG: riboflavin synthase [Verrucomicrobiae bacterium]|nr:riboflavin synthase [Verrucomicrobiae bacterium]